MFVRLVCSEYVCMNMYACESCRPYYTQGLHLWIAKTRDLQPEGRRINSRRCMIDLQTASRNRETFRVWVCLCWKNNLFITPCMILFVKEENNYFRWNNLNLFSDLRKKKICATLFNRLAQSRFFLKSENRFKLFHRK